MLPIDNLYKSFLEGARKHSQGPLVESGIQILRSAKLQYSGPHIEITENGVFPNPELDPYFEEHCWVTMGVVQKRKILVSRPIFKEWFCEVEIMFEPEIINKETLITAIESAGKLKGIGTYRSKYGRYIVEILD